MQNQEKKLTIKERKVEASRDSFWLKCELLLEDWWGRILVGSFVVVSFSLNFFLAHFYILHTPTQETLAKEFPFLSKRILVENSNDILINFVPLRTALREYVTNSRLHLGVYFEYLPSGISVGVNDREEVRLASLSKVPLSMAILKKEEAGKLSLEEKVVLDPSDLDNGFGDLWKTGAGSVFTVRELVEKSLKDSDNTAYRALFRQLTPEEVNDVYSNLEIQVSFAENNYPLVSPKSYSSILRSLYLSSYLSKESSQYLLEVLTTSNFDNTITKPIPKNIKVAHKVGVFDKVDSIEKVFIDCGIVYIPSRPYILCLFVEDQESVADYHMATISKMVYDYVSSVKSSSNNK
jgi:beta-lactamase class A